MADHLYVLFRVRVVLHAVYTTYLNSSLAVLRKLSHIQEL